MWVLMLALSAQAGPSGTQIAQRHPDQPIVIAHRGASLAAPENTLAAYRAAIEQGARVAETDVHLSADGVVIVLHDKTLARTTNGTGLVNRRSASDLSTLEAGSWFSPEFSAEPLPTLAQLLALVRDKMVLCIEIKAAPEAGGESIALKVRDLLDASGGRDQAIIFSFYPQQVAASKAAMPRVPALFLIRPGDGPIPYATGALTMARSLGADMIGLDHRRTTPAFTAQAQAAGFPVFVYTVDGTSNIDVMLHAGVDGLITNGPAATQAHLDSLRPSTP